MFLHIAHWKVSCIDTMAKIAILTPRARKKDDFPGAVLKAHLRGRNHQKHKKQHHKEFLQATCVVWALFVSGRGG